MNRIELRVKEIKREALLWTGCFKIRLFLLIVKWRLFNSSKTLWIDWKLLLCEDYTTYKRKCKEINRDNAILDWRLFCVKTHFYPLLEFPIQLFMSSLLKNKDSWKYLLVSCLLFEILENVIHLNLIHFGGYDR